MRFYNALENARATLQVLAIALIASFFLNLLMMFGWYHAQSKVEVYIPPQIPSTGITLKAGEYPRATIYSFAYYIWQSVNNWPEDGSDDYKQAIQQFSPFLTPRFKNFLIHDYNDRFSQGEVQNRIRTLQGMSGTAFKPEDVEAIGNDTWIVHLHMRLAEHMSINGNPVKDAAIDYAIRVVRYDINAKSNPWGLALDGFIEEPQRIKTFI